MPTTPRTDPDPALRVIVGPTASGKSELALRVAERAGAEIVSLDSMQVYRGMDIGTAKPDAAERARVPHHMLDLVAPTERYGVHAWLRDLEPVLADLRARGRRALFVGGTGLYLKALAGGFFEGPEHDPALRALLERRAAELGGAALHAELSAVDPPSAARLHPNDHKRVVRALEVHAQTGRPLSYWQTQWKQAPARALRIVGLERDVPDLDRRIRQRTRALLVAGWPEEAARIRATSGFGTTAAQALGYAQALELFDGRLDLDAAVEAIVLATRQFARRQRTWYRKFPAIVWLRPESRAPADLADEALGALGWPG